MRRKDKRKQETYRPGPQNQQLNNHVERSRPHLGSARITAGRPVLFTELKADEAFQIDQSLLAQTPDDPEANLLAGEILIREHEFEKAEPFLSKCQDLKPEMMPHRHVLLGKIYAATNRIPAAITEYQLGLASDEDGSIHYQLARLYLKTGDTAAAAEQIQISKQLRKRWDNLAHVSLEELSTDVSRQ